MFANPAKGEGRKLVVVSGDHAVDERSCGQRARRPCHLLDRLGIFTECLRHPGHRGQRIAVHFQAPSQSSRQSIAHLPRIAPGPLVPGELVTKWIERAEGDGVELGLFNGGFNRAPPRMQVLRIQGRNRLVEQYAQLLGEQEDPVALFIIQRIRIPAQSGGGPAELRLLPVRSLNRGPFFLQKRLVDAERYEPSNHPINQIGAGLAKLATVHPGLSLVQELDPGPWRWTAVPGEASPSTGRYYLQVGKRIPLPAGPESVPALEIGSALFCGILVLVEQEPPVRGQPLRERIERDVYEFANRLCPRVQNAGQSRAARPDPQGRPSRSHFRAANPFRIHPVDFEAKNRHRSPRYREATRPR